MNDIEQRKKIAKEIRRDIVEMLYRTNSHHIGGSLSMVELLVALYFKILNTDPKNPIDPNRDRFILSKGHGCPALFAVLKEKGFISEDEFKGFAIDGGCLNQHTDFDLPKGIETTSGSLGHGLSIGAGMALVAKSDNKQYKTFVYLGDGELNEGSNWEAILFASQHKLDNLTAIVDYNKLQFEAPNEEVIGLKPLSDKWNSFGWEVKEVDGHNMEEIIKILEEIPFQKEKPNCIIAHTIKGKGISFMENKAEWHSKKIGDDDYKEAIKEL